mmetsp:Transcript_41523/g.100860  ORF Transcript_41523/g.100860 Transcript_41523/m.100860 type:complete len:222 (+) Transcript_41523:763-1428(+)
MALSSFSTNLTTLCRICVPSEAKSMSTDDKSSRLIPRQTVRVAAVNIDFPGTPKRKDTSPMAEPGSFTNCSSTFFAFPASASLVASRLEPPESAKDDRFSELKAFNSAEAFGLPSTEHFDSRRCLSSAHDTLSTLPAGLLVFSASSTEEPLIDTFPDSRKNNSLATVPGLKSTSPLTNTRRRSTRHKSASILELHPASIGARRRTRMFMSCSTSLRNARGS